MTVIMETGHPSVVSARVVALVGERHPGRTRRPGNTAVRTARTSAMVPHNQPVGWLSDRGVRLQHRAARRIVHPVAALPLRLDRTFEDVGCLEEPVKQSRLVTGAWHAVWHLRGVVGRPPLF